MDQEKIRTHVDSMLGALRNDRMSWWTHWREIADYLLPRRYKWLVTPNQMNRGSPINTRIIDSTPTIAWRNCASGMHAGMTSPARQWFKMKMIDTALNEVQEIKEWLDEVTKRMLTVLAGSNFYTSIQTVHGDLAAFGTGVMVIYEDFEEVIRCYNMCAGEYFLGNSNRQKVEILYREFTRTAKQIVDEFGIANVSDDVKGIYESVSSAGKLREFVVCHAIEPNDDFIAGEFGLRGMKYREVYWEYGSAKVKCLRVAGFREKPFVAARWDVQGNDAYGRSPGMDALGDIKQLQVEQKRKAQGIDKMVNPPLVGDISLKNEPATTLPGGITYVSTTAGANGLKPIYEVNPQLGELKEDIREVQMRVKEVFFYDLWLMISNLETVRSAAEIYARKEEKLIMLGPVLERTENEALDPALARVYAIMMRKGKLPPPPEAMRGQAIGVDYTSMLSEAQKAVMTAGVERLTQFVGGIAAVNPDILDTLDWDEIVDQYAEYLGVAPSMVRPFAEVLKLRQEKQQAIEAQRATEQGTAAVQGAKVLSETDVGGGISALQQMMGA